MLPCSGLAPEVCAVPRMAKYIQQARWQVGGSSLPGSYGVLQRHSDFIIFVKCMLSAGLEHTPFYSDMTASSENLYKAPQLWPQEPPKKQNPTLASPASYHYHKGTDESYRSQRNENKSSAKVHQNSKIMYSFSTSSNTVLWLMVSFSDHKLPEHWAKSQEWKTPLHRWLLKRKITEFFWIIYFEILWMNLRSIHRTWKVWRMLQKIIAYLFFFFFSENVCSFTHEKIKAVHSRRVKDFELGNSAQGLCGKKNIALIQCKNRYS